MFVAAAGLHLLQSIAVFALIPHLNGHGGGGVFTVTRTVAVWAAPTAGQAANSMVGNFTVGHRLETVGTVDVRLAIAFFFLLSAGFQALTM